MTHTIQEYQMSVNYGLRDEEFVSWIMPVSALESNGTEVK